MPINSCFHRTLTVISIVRIDAHFTAPSLGAVNATTPTAHISYESFLFRRGWRNEIWWLYIKDNNFGKCFIFCLQKQPTFHCGWPLWWFVCFDKALQVIFSPKLSPSRTAVLIIQQTILMLSLMNNYIIY